MGPTKGKKIEQELHFVKIGYFVPEFPGSTHIFFWRELRALGRLGVTCDIVSTHVPESRRMSHTWSQEGIRRTTYLLPLKPSRLLGGLWEILRAGPGGWERCLGAIFSADGYSTLKGRARMAGLAMMGGQLAWLARRREWRHLHVHSCADSAHLAMFAHLISGLPYSLTLHGHMGDYGPNQPNKWKHAAFGIVITRRLLEVVRGELDGALPARVEVAPMGVELESFVPSGTYQSWDGSGPCRVFSCGRLNPCKGHDHLIRSIGLLRDRGIDVQLHIAGADDYASQKHRAALEELISELKLGDRVVLLGATSEERVREELEQAHVFALASRRDELGVATMEAMAMRLPVVVTRSGAVTEMIDDGMEGILVEPEDPAAMADGLARVLADPALAARLGDAARRKVEQKFHSGVSAQTLLRCLRAPSGPSREIG
jgi:colanic acid/amylovoran biosynthesis glycosyltransferase